jgi:hypothetical protein
MTTLLVSFCNRNLDQPDLAVIDTESGVVSARWIPDSKLFRGCTGMCEIGASAGYAVILQGNPNQIAFLDEKLVFLFSRKLTHKGIHTLLNHNGRLFCALTGSDAIGEITHSNVEIVWQRAQESEDTIHLNSIAFTKAGLIASCFGEKLSATWADNSLGSVFIPSNGITLWSGLKQPHSLCQVHESVAFCESANNVIVVGDKCVSFPYGYARGMCHVGGLLYIGSSELRQTSIATGIKRIHPDYNLHRNVAGIATFNLDSGSFVDPFIDLSFFASEIFEVIPIESPTSKW